MDMPPEAINPCSSCHFNSLCFTYLQRLQGCQWNHNKCSSVSTLFDETGQWLLLQTPSSKAKSNAAGFSGWQRGQACVTQMFKWLCWHWLVKLSSSFWLGKPIMQQWSIGINPIEGAGSLHSPSPGLLEPPLAVSRACLTKKTHMGWDFKATFFLSPYFLCI